MYKLCALFLVAGLAVGCGHQPKIRFEAVYFDMDGTLLGSDSQVRPASVKALQRYRACGGKVGLASGRTFEQVKPYLAELRPNLPIVVYNGAVVMSANGSVTLKALHLTPTAVQRTLALLPQLEGLWGVIVHEEQETIVDRDNRDFIEKIAEGHIRPTRVEPDMAGSYKGTPVKILMLVKPDLIEAAAQAINTNLDGEGRAVVSSSFTIEVLPVGVTKATPIFAALNEAGIDPRNAVAFGDSGNDVEMLQRMGVSFAVGNCRKSACDAALARIDTNDTDAIAHTIERVLLTPDCP